MVTEIHPVKKLHEAVVDFFEVSERHKYANVERDFIEEIDKGHGRLETRRYWITENLTTLPDIEKWAGLKSIRIVERVCLIGEKETLERRYFINSFAADASIFANMYGTF